MEVLSDWGLDPSADGFAEALKKRCLKEGVQPLEVEVVAPAPTVEQPRNVLVQLPKRKITPARLLPCSSLELVKSLVLDEVGIGVLPRRVAEHGTRKRLHSLSPPLPLYRDSIALVRRYDVPLTAAIRVVIEQLSAHCKEIR